MIKDLTQKLNTLVRPQKVKDDDPDASMEKLFKEKSPYFKMPQAGEIIEGTIISATKNEIEVDITGIGTGVIRGPELYLPPENKVKVGDKILATILEVENEDGKFELSSKRAYREAAWLDINKMIKENKTIEVKVTQANKGGLLTLIKGIPAFLPVSQLHYKHYPRVEGADRNKILAKLNQLINETLKVKIIDSNPEEDRLIISEKQATSEEQEEIIKKLKVGNVVEGEITGVVDFGAFMRFNGLEGLIHISELAWKRIENPEDIVKVGDKVKAKIISIDAARISLSLKALQKDPWEKKAKKYKVGQVVTGEVTKLSPFGAFVQLDQDIHGLAHISEIVGNGGGGRLEDFLKIGQERKFKILSIEPEEHRLGLSIKALAEVKQSKVKKEPQDPQKSARGKNPNFKAKISKVKSNPKSK